jgi:hypothetical protein
MIRSKIGLIVSISLEAIITALATIHGNYIAATGWGFLMLTNIGLLLDVIKKDKENGNSN